jgi:hypothetical protein
LAVLENSIEEDVPRDSPEEVHWPIERANDGEASGTMMNMNDIPNGGDVELYSSMPLRAAELDLTWNSNEWDNWGMYDWDTLTA